MSMTEIIYNGLVSYPWDEVNSHHLNRYIQFINAILTKRPENVKFEYSERHHILPKSMGGTNDKENLIYLSYREHYLAHYMLAKAFPNHNIVFALTKMMDGKERIKNSKLYEDVKIITGELHRLKKIGVTWEDRFGLEESIKRKKKHSEQRIGDNNPFYGKKHSEETRLKMSQNHVDFSKEKHPMYGKHLSEETRKKISENHADVSGSKNPFYGVRYIGELNPMYGKKYTWMNDGNKNKRVDLDKVEYYTNLGYKKGFIIKKQN